MSLLLTANRSSRLPRTQGMIVNLEVHTFHPKSSNLDCVTLDEVRGYFIVGFDIGLAKKSPLARYLHLLQHAPCSPAAKSRPTFFSSAWFFRGLKAKINHSSFLLRSQQVWGVTGRGNDGGISGGVVGARRRGRGTGSNLLLLLGYLYNYGVAHCTLVYDMIGLLVDGALHYCCTDAVSRRPYVPALLLKTLLSRSRVLGAVRFCCSAGADIT